MKDIKVLKVALSTRRIYNSSKVMICTRAILVFFIYYRYLANIFTSWWYNYRTIPVVLYRRFRPPNSNPYPPVSFQIVSLTELMAGVKAPARTVQLFQLTCWPMGHKVPTSTNSLVELMNMVERWRQRCEYGPVVVVSQ